MNIAKQKMDTENVLQCFFITIFQMIKFPYTLPENFDCAEVAISCEMQKKMWAVIDVYSTTSQDSMTFISNYLVASTLGTLELVCFNNDNNLIWLHNYIFLHTIWNAAFHYAPWSTQFQLHITSTDSETNDIMSHKPLLMHR